MSSRTSVQSAFKKKNSERSHTTRLSTKSTRLLPENDLRDLFEANGLTLLRQRYDDERRELGPYLDLAGCEGPAREEALRLAPHGSESYAARLGWYLLERR